MPLTKPEADRVIDVIRSLVSADTYVAKGGSGAPANGTPVQKGTPAAEAVAPEMADLAGKLRLEAGQLELLYQAMKRRFIEELPDDPILVRLVASRPEIVVEIERRTVTLSASTLKGRLARMIVGGWFDAKRTTGGTRTELSRTGTDPGGGGQLSTALGEMVRDGFLVREGDGYARAVGLKVSEKEIGAV